MCSEVQGSRSLVSQLFSVVISKKSRKVEEKVFISLVYGVSFNSEREKLLYLVDIYWGNHEIYARKLTLFCEGNCCLLSSVYCLLYCFFW